MDGGTVTGKNQGGNCPDLKKICLLEAVVTGMHIEFPGDTFVFWNGCRPVLPVSNPEQIREILSNKFGHFRKVTIRPNNIDVVGESVLSLEGERWVQHRRIVGPAFFTEKLKVMMPTMLACIDAVLDQWESRIPGRGGDGKEFDAHEQFKIITADIIAHTAFGSSYKEGKRVFELQKEQGLLFAKLLRSIKFPGSRCLPTSQNRYLWRLNAEMSATVRKIITQQGEHCGGSDLLGIMMAANREELSGSQKNLTLSTQEIVDECKTFFLAGHETTSNLMTWATMMLAVHADWQEKAREEVLCVCGNTSPTYELLHSLKIVGMVLYETLRLYPPGAYIFRETSKRMTVGNISVPAGVSLLIPIIHVHTDPAWWGEDVLQFNPQRFVNGINGACRMPSAFNPFSMGLLGAEFRHARGTGHPCINAAKVLLLARAWLRALPYHGPDLAAAARNAHHLQETRIEVSAEQHISL